MKKCPVIFVLLFFVSFLQVNAQTNQIVSNGAATSAVNFSGTGCTYNWVNDNPAIGLGASGVGNIPGFAAINTGNVPITATITATPITGGFAYISNSRSNTVSVISLATHMVVGTIPVQNDPIGVAVSANGSKVYVVNSFSNSVSVINTTTNTVIKNIGINGYSYGICISSDGTRVYVPNYNNQTVSVIDAVNDTFIGTIPGGDRPYCVAISPDGSRLYVTNYEYSSGNPSTVTVVNTLTNAIVTQIQVGVEPEGITISADGARVYVANAKSNSVSVINTATNTLTKNIPVGYFPRAVVISPDGTKLFTKEGNTKRLMITDLLTDVSTPSAQAGNGSIGLDVSPDGRFVYLVNQVDDNVTVVDVNTNAVVRVIDVQDSPVAVGKFIAGSVGCSPVTFTITVNPSPRITFSNATGNVMACSGVPSADPNIGSFTLSGSFLTGNVEVTAPSAFEISLSSNTGYGNALNLLPANGTVNSVVYFRSSAAAPVGNVATDITANSAGANATTIPVTATINVIPAVSALPDQIVKNGDAVSVPDFTGTADTYRWTNNLTAIGLVTDGTNNIPTFNAINWGATAVTAIITITPVNTTGCLGEPVSFNVTVEPDEPVDPPDPPDNSNTSGVPNTFTPNGDGINDTWVIAPLALYANVTVTIYSRNGQVIFQSKGYSQPWDGTSNSKQVPAGIYYYFINADKNKKISGYLTVVR